MITSMDKRKIGHIKRHIAAILAPMMDAAANSNSNSTNLRIEETAPRRGNTSTPLTLDFYGHRRPNTNGSSLSSENTMDEWSIH